MFILKTQTILVIYLFHLLLVNGLIIFTRWRCDLKRRFKFMVLVDQYADQNEQQMLWIKKGWISMNMLMALCTHMHPCHWGVVSVSRVVKGYRDLGCWLWSDISKGFYDTPTSGFSCPRVELEKVHVGWNLHLYSLTNLGWIFQTKSFMKRTCGGDDANKGGGWVKLLPLPSGR